MRWSASTAAWALATVSPPAADTAGTVRSAGTTSNVSARGASVVSTAGRTTGPPSKDAGTAPDPDPPDAADDCPDRSASSFACAVASVDRAWAMAASSDVVSSDASVVPAATCCPTATGTELTCPATGKERSASEVGVTVPAASRVEATSPVRAVAVR